MNNLTNYFLLRQFYLFNDLDKSNLENLNTTLNLNNTTLNLNNTTLNLNNTLTPYSQSGGNLNTTLNLNNTLTPYSQSGGKNNKKRWDKLHHNGPLFPDEYQPHKIPIIYKNEKIVLPADAEEFATVYSKYIDSEYIKHKKFNKNFWNDWKHYLKNTKISSLEDCDFSLIKKYIIEQKEKKSLLSSEEKQKLLEGKKKQEEPYLYALVDNKKEKIGNFRIEPPGIFIGRGCHPLLGSIKPRLTPKDIILNLSKDAPIPNSPLGNKWGEIIHNPYVDWLASFPDNISGKTKYIWLSASSSWKMEIDHE